MKQHQRGLMAFDGYLIMVQSFATWLLYPVVAFP